MIRYAIESDFEILNKLIKELDENYIFDSTNPFFKCIVYDNEGIKGFLKYSLIYDKLEIDYIFVKKEYRNQNIGMEMMKFIETENVKSFSLEVKESNKSAIEFYKKNNYKIVATKKNYYKGEDGYLMVKEV